jgi:uncharacterized membrane protein YsdA (DUF1294 family)
MKQEDGFVTYQLFKTKDEVTDFVNLLNEHSVPFEFEDSAIYFDPSFSFNEVNREYRLKLRKRDFDKVDTLLLKASEKQLDKVDKSHYLFEFSNQELEEVIEKRDEWSKLDFLLAQKILKERGKEINSDQLNALQKKRIQKLSTQNEDQPVTVAAGYFFAILGGPLGFIIGGLLMFHKKTLPNGDRVYGHSIKDRKHGFRIILLTIISIVLWLVFI